MARTEAKTGTAGRARARRKSARGRDFRADTDTQLMLQVCQGSAEAGDALVRRNFDRVARYIGRVVRDRRPVEDLAQDVFLKVLKNSSSYEPTAKFSTWLYRIATNTALNYLKQSYVKKRREPESDGEADKPEIEDRSGATPDRELTLDELRGSVSAAISDLPVNQRIALALFEYEGLSYEQVAAVMDVTVEAVRSQLKRARETLRGTLRDFL